MLLQKYYITPWIAQRTNSSIVNELHLPMSRLFHFVRCQNLNTLATSWFREDNDGRNGSREKKHRRIKTSMEERRHRYIWRTVSISQTFGQKRREEDMLSQKKLGPI